MSRRQKRTAKRVEGFWAEKYRAAGDDLEALAAVRFQHLRAILADNRHTVGSAPWVIVNERLADLLDEVAAATQREVFGNKTSGRPGRWGSQRADAPTGA